MNSKSVALALGSGGARGYAHIGAIQVIEERGLTIAGIAGSSMGALVGGLYAAGKLDDFTEWVTTLTQLDMVRLLDISVTAPGVIRAEKIVKRVRDILGDTTIEELPIPYTAVATDLTAGRSIWFQRGPVHDAIRASIAIPGVITPHTIDGRLLADGGILAPLPLAPIVSAGADLTIGISLGAEEQRVENGGDAPVSESSSEVGTMDDWIGRFRRGAAQLFERESDDSADDTIGPALTSRFDVMNRSLDVMGAALARYQLAGYPPDVLIRVPRTSCRAFDFHRAEEMIALGRDLTEKALDAAGLTADSDATNADAADVDPPPAGQVDIA